MAKKGRKMTPEEIADWKKGLTDIEDSIAELYKKDKKVKNENNKRTN